MTGQWTGRGPQGPGRDESGRDEGGRDDQGPDRDAPGSVEDFFAAHRAQIREEPADELTWQRIRDGRRLEHPRRRGARAGALVAAAAALAFVFGPSLIPDTDLPDIAAPATSTGQTEPTGTEPTGTAPTGTGPSADPTATSPDSAGQSVSTPVPEGEIPQDGWFADTTSIDSEPTVDSGVRFGIVNRPCPRGGLCSLLVTSADGGTVWAPQADLAALGQVDHVRFADARRGWTWGSQTPGMWATTDGGASWTAIPIPGDRALEVSVRDGILLAITAQDIQCVTTPCDATLAAVLTEATDEDWTQDVIADLGQARDASVLDTVSVRYVSTTSATGVVTAFRLQDGTLETMAELSSCGTGPVGITASRQDPSHLWALCDDERGLALQESENGGRTWLPSNLTVPSFVLGERPPLMASTSADHLLLVGAGNLTLTTDGGATWSREAFLPGATSAPASLELTLLGDVIAYPTPEQSGPDLAYWQSVDGGVTWEVTTPRG